MAESSDWTELKAEVLQMTSEHVDRLTGMWVQMFDPEACEETLRHLKTHVSSYYNDLIEQSVEKRQVIEAEIVALRSEAADMTRLLNKGVDIAEMPPGMPLTVYQIKLDKSIEHLRDELRARRDEICELLLQQEQLCDELGELPRPLLADPLPKPDEISGFREHLKHLREERTRRMEELFQLRNQIKHDMKLLELLPQTDADERLLNQPNHSLTPDTFNALRQLQKCFSEQVAELRQRIDDMRSKIHVLWERLQETEEFAMRPVREAKDYTQRTYDILMAELQRCQVLRRQNLKTFIEQLRLEIAEWWELTLKSEQERKRFSNYSNDWYNEDLLELHELELEDLKSHYNNNKEIYELYARRAELWERMEALEEKAKAPNRYNNRGGHLLKEERERKAIDSKLPKIEQQITELVQAYVERSHSAFLVHGVDILERMAEDWTSRRQAKEQQSSARKHAGVTATTPGKMLPPQAPGSAAPGSRTPMALRNMSAMSSSTMSLRKTPSNSHLATTMGASGAKTTGNLHKRKFPSTADDVGGATAAAKQQQSSHAKRSLLTTLNAFKPAAAGSAGLLRLQSSAQRLAANRSKSFKSPLKKVRVLANTLRRSSGLGRRSMGPPGSGASSAAAKKQKPRSRLQAPRLHVQGATSDESETDREALGEARDDTYESFEKFIEPAARSSVLPNGLGRQTRAKCNGIMTPIRQRPLAQHNNNNRNTPKSIVIPDEQTRLATLPKPRIMSP